MQTMYQKRQSVHHDGKRLRFKTTMDVEPIIEGVKHLNNLVNPERDRTGRLYLGSIDPLTAANWARECGHAIGTKPWSAYAKKKLLSGDYAKFQADYQKKVHQSCRSATPTSKTS